MGSRALLCGVFAYLLNLMKSAPFAEDAVRIFPVECEGENERSEQERESRKKEDVSKDGRRGKIRETNEN